MAERISIDPVIGQIVSAGYALFKGWEALKPRFTRLHMFTREGGKNNLALFVLYLIPQALNVGLMLLLFFGLIFALIGGLASLGYVAFSPEQQKGFFLKTATFIYGFGWTFILAAIIFFAVIYWDLFARGALLIARIANLIPGLRGRFGPDGSSLGWHQARELVRHEESAQLFWADKKGIERLTAATFNKMAADNLEGQDRAATPEALGNIDRANVALIGCIIEQSEVDLGKPRRKWDIFYAALAEVAEKQNLLAPQTLFENDPKVSFAERVRTSANAILVAKGQPEISSDIDQTVDQAVNTLITYFWGNATRLASGWRLFGPVQAMFRNAKKFPKLDDDRMRPQFVKLCIRWGVIAGIEPRLFIQPFSVGMGWLELHYGALQTLLDQETVNFNGPIDRPVSRIVASRVMDGVLERLNASINTESKALRDRYATIAEPKRSWLIRQEADTTMWRLSRELEAKGTEAKWEGDDWHWKLSNRVATRV